MFLFIFTVISWCFIARDKNTRVCL